MASPVAWDRVSTVLLDMDGTLLDLAFDNYFWRELIPSEFARRHAMAPTEAQAHVFALYQGRAGTLDWYCLDHWQQALGLDIVALKREHLGGVRLLPGVPAFLEALAASGLRRVIATNAHGTTLALKLEQTGLDRLVDEVHSSHDYGSAKEEQEFWRAFQSKLGFEPADTLLIDDNLAVLDAADEFGIGHRLAISQPDSTRAPHAHSHQRHPVVPGVASLTAALVGEGERPASASEREKSEPD